MAGSLTSDTDEKKSVGTTLKENSLKAAGWSYVIGDLALAAAKKMEDDKHGLAGASLWLAGGAAAGFFGNPKAEKQLQLFEHRLGAYLKKQGIKIPSNPTTGELSKTGGVIDHIEQFLYAHPSEMLNAAYAIGGALILKGGMKTKTPMDTLSGGLITIGALTGLLIPEKTPDPDHPAQGAAGKAWEWVQEKPLRLSGALYLANNVPLLVESIKKHRVGNKSCIPRYITTASYIFANTMLSLSSKDNTAAKNADAKNKVLDTLAQESALVIAAQPKETQEALVQNIAGYLSAQPEIKKTAPEIATLLHAKLAETSKAESMRWQSLASKPSQLSPSL